MLALFERAPGWQASDLSGIYFMGDNGYSQSTEPPLGFYAAWALAKVGRRDEAFRALQPTLHFRGAFDPGYELLLDLKGAEALPLLDRFFARDQFEARPLIWKAEELRRLGRLGEAEQVARKAISVDPSDGESPTGDRLRAYAVLADIKEGQGAKDEAAQLRNAVEAIRMAEHADDFIQNGLIARGTKVYEEALAKFDDAYCIQSRLAVQLASEGHDEEAAEHFRRAYELMPSSFGRVESHCFGCEGAFSNPKAQRIAVTTLGGIAKKTPNNPRVHYLLGYLYKQESRIADAVAEFRRATDLDPDYLNAWKQISNIGSQAGDDLLKRARFAIIRLDPNGVHEYDDWESSPLGPKLTWQAYQNARLPSYVMPKSLLKLSASKPNPPRLRFGGSQDLADWPQVSEFSSDDNPRWRIPVTPSLRVSQLSIVRQMAHLLSADERTPGLYGMG